MDFCEDCIYFDRITTCNELENHGHCRRNPPIGGIRKYAVKGVIQSSDSLNNLFEEYVNNKQEWSKSQYDHDSLARLRKDWQSTHSTSLTFGEWPVVSKYDWCGEFTEA
jgi:hypothetical protein